MREEYEGISDSFSCNLDCLTAQPVVFSFILSVDNRKQRKKLHDRLRQSKRNKRNNKTSSGVGPKSARGRQTSNLPLQDLQLTNVCFYFLVSHKISLNLYTHVCLLHPLYSHATGCLHSMERRRRQKPPSPQAIMPYQCTNPQCSPTSPAKGEEGLSVSVVNLVWFHLWEMWCRTGTVQSTVSS